ncbi:MAG: ATP-dependent DNA helicase [Pseudomonadota bacterium]|nr:ATP-dependent DNA helicase [Pseudomonadota bacterium]
MTEEPTNNSQVKRRLDIPALAVDHRRAVLADAAGNLRAMSKAAAAALISDGTIPIVCHLPTTARRLKTSSFLALDLLELYAFVRPANVCQPTVSGLSMALGFNLPDELEDQAENLQFLGGILLTELISMSPGPGRDRIAEIARSMEAANWGWSPLVLRALRSETPPEFSDNSITALEIWRRLPEWSEYASDGQPGNLPVAPDNARARLASMVGKGAEDRPQQGDYASAVSHAFAPRDEIGVPQTVIAEAGTGVGKTLGYIAPASLWVEQNQGTVWISTFTRNLQRQIDDELKQLHPDPAIKKRKVVIRKGRENYLCLLNFEEAVAGLRDRPANAVGLGLLARWAEVTRDGDIGGGDFPPWLIDLAGTSNTVGMTDRRGECIYSACAHYHKCFVEKTVRRAKRAEIVIANHALVLSHIATGAQDDGPIPNRLIFDEGHHLFDAADSAFSTQLTGQEGMDLRHWLLGAEDGRKTRTRGLLSRIEDVALLDEPTMKSVDAIIRAASILPGPGWNQRIAEGTASGVTETFLACVRQQVYARAKNSQSPYDLEIGTEHPVPRLLDSARELGDKLASLAQPMQALSDRLMSVLDERSTELKTPNRNRIESVSRGLSRRADRDIVVWGSMLAGLADGCPQEFVDWFRVTRSSGRDVDIGMHRHWIDPMIPFARTVADAAHGIVITSATLRDNTGNTEIDWQTAEARTGTVHFKAPPLRAQMTSPFDYTSQTRVLVVTDVRKDDLTQVATAYRELFLAAGGGALGLFTAISRLRGVHEIIAPTIEDAGYRLLAQHVDRMDTGSLVDIFRAEERSCLLGTDAVRDGIDVPGQNLRLIVFDRVPWPRPTILHRARRKEFSQSRYDDLITRLRLKQAYGRLIRRQTDTGVFVLLDPMTPSRMMGAFPENVEVIRTGLKDAIATTRDFLV